MGKLETQERPG